MDETQNRAWTNNLHAPVDEKFARSRINEYQRHAEQSVDERLAHPKSRKSNGIQNRAWTKNLHGPNQ